MACCTFFGHRDCPNDLFPLLLDTLRELIETRHVSEFYLGNQGNFDSLALAALRKLSRDHPHIRYSIVLAYLPGPGQKQDPHTLFPEGMEKAPPRFAVCRRNRWMLERADWVAAYVVRPWGGAAQFVRLAQRKGKSVLLLPVDPHRAGAL